MRWLTIEFYGYRMCLGGLYIPSATGMPGKGFTLAIVGPTSNASWSEILKTHFSKRKVILIACSKRQLSPKRNSPQKAVFLRRNLPVGDLNRVPFQNMLGRGRERSGSAKLTVERSEQLSEASRRAIRAGT